jgi:hypothetical protein
MVNMDINNLVRSVFSEGCLTAGQREELWRALAGPTCLRYN